MFLLGCRGPRRGTAPKASIAIREQEVTLAELSDDAAEYLDSSRLADVRRLGVSKATLQQMMSYLA
ncbi:MAG: hypothetical protein ACYSU0_18205, partial [Planctomycetota bacterium]